MLGFDAGMGALKLYEGDRQTEFVSQVASVQGHSTGRMVGLRAAKPPLQVISEFGEFFVGPRSHQWGRPIENLDYSRLTGTPEMRALLYGALARHFGEQPPAEPLSFVVGLPLEPLSGEDAPAVVAAVKGWLTGEHHFEVTSNRETREYTLAVDNALVTSQPVGALFDYLLTETGDFVPQRKPLLRGEVGVVSIGFNTLELLVVREREPVPALSYGFTSGVRRLLRLADPQRRYSLGELDERLRAGKLDLRSALPVWEQEVWGHVEERWGGVWPRFDLIIIVGGGALLAPNLPRKFGNKAVVPQSPVMAIARGLWKMGVNRAKRRRKK